MKYQILKNESFDFLSKLLNTYSPSGYEKQTAKIFSDYIEVFCDSIKSDIMCNTVGVLFPKKNMKVMLAGHYDEIGFQVVYISKEGYIYFRQIGGIDKLTIPGTEVIILSSQGNIPGVIGKKPPQIEKEMEKNQPVELQDLWIDIGATSGEEVKKLISIGDPISFKANYKQLGEHRLMSKGIDDKIGVFIIAETLRVLRSKKCNVGVYGVATSQEEIGTRGVTTISYDIEPNIGFVVDVGISTDVPNIPQTLLGEFNLGGGPGISHGAENNIMLIELLQKVAKSHKIPYQNVTSIRASGGTDTSQLQLSRKGVATSLISIPNRYMHSPVEICDFKDIDNTIFLLTETIAGLSGKETFLPYSRNTNL